MDDRRPELPDSVRAQWAKIDAAGETLDLTSELVATGQPWPEADEQGRVIWRDPCTARSDTG
ncbi:hypothetical protein [Paraconexibacter algicola]|uniref:Uncharacterized protein n=1 Tax=Paraconexibacter algicola TaxID=2133960 RepID=A0A2T4UEG3_9ACTN|nr:hypothetical protein [Paraconexibacter algicola]PTL56135.1 hypothetical protein C7Y72_14165 [Paraconexibacter algicola]